MRSLYWLLIDVAPLLAAPLCGGPLGWAWILWPLRAAGVLLVAWGVLLNAVAGRTLRLYGHSRPGPRFVAPDRLVDVGVYSCMRHPAQLGLMAIGVGLGLLAGTPASLLAAAVPVAGGLAFIVLLEEPEARRLLGRAYHEYEERVPAFSLGPGCLLRGLEAIRRRRSS